MLAAFLKQVCKQTNAMSQNLTDNSILNNFLAQRIFWIKTMRAEGTGWEIGCHQRNPHDPCLLPRRPETTPQGASFSCSGRENAYLITGRRTAHLEAGHHELVIPRVQ